MPVKNIANLAFYRFVQLDEPHALDSEIRSKCLDLDLLGTVLLANEGINGMLAGTPQNCEAFADWMHADERFTDMPFKVSYSDEVPFDKLIVRVKREIVTMSVPDVDTVSHTAPHVPPETLRDWLRSGEDILLVDTRNDYEYALGTFSGAVDPDTGSFGDFPQWVHSHRDELRQRKVVMFCTGGIRCEKATSWMLDQGFDNVWQLEGGVLNYFQHVEDADRDWEGELFVFDARVALDTHLDETDTTLCPECGAPVRAGIEATCDCAKEE